MRLRLFAPLLACAVVSTGCGPAALEDEPVELAVETFDTLEPVLLDATAVSAVVSGEEEDPEYSSNPPTSGSRSSDWAKCGIYRQEIPDLYQVASLARGAVLVQYRSSAAADVRDSVEESVRQIGDGVIVAPNSDLPAAVVATAWGTMLKLSSADAVQLQAFVDQYGGSGPSTADCPWTVDES